MRLTKVICFICAIFTVLGVSNYAESSLAARRMTSPRPRPQPTVQAKRSAIVPPSSHSQSLDTRPSDSNSLLEGNSDNNDLRNQVSSPMMKKEPLSSPGYGVTPAQGYSPQNYGPAPAYDYNYSAPAQWIDGSQAPVGSGGWSGDYRGVQSYPQGYQTDGEGAEQGYFGENTGTEQGYP